MVVSDDLSSMTTSTTVCAGRVKASSVLINGSKSEGLRGQEGLANTVMSLCVFLPDSLENAVNSHDEVGKAGIATDRQHSSSVAIEAATISRGSLLKVTYSIPIDCTGLYNG